MHRKSQIAHQIATEDAAIGGVHENAVAPEVDLVVFDQCSRRVPDIYAVATRIQSVIATSDNDIVACRGIFGAVNINPIEVSEDAVILDQNTCGCPMELDAGINCFMC